jgi:hypothetical protein
MRHVFQNGTGHGQWQESPPHPGCEGAVLLTCPGLLGTVPCPGRIPTSLHAGIVAMDGVELPFRCTSCGFTCTALLSGATAVEG